MYDFNYLTENENKQSSKDCDYDGQSPFQGIDYTVQMSYLCQKFDLGLIDKIQCFIEFLILIEQCFDFFLQSCQFCFLVTDIMSLQGLRNSMRKRIGIV